MASSNSFDHFRFGTRSVGVADGLVTGGYFGIIVIQNGTSFTSLVTDNNHEDPNGVLAAGTYNAMDYLPVGVEQVQVTAGAIMLGKVRKPSLARRLGLNKLRAGGGIWSLLSFLSESERQRVLDADAASGGDGTLESIRSRVAWVISDAGTFTAQSETTATLNYDVDGTIVNAPSLPSSVAVSQDSAIILYGDLTTVLTLHLNDNSISDVGPLAGLTNLTDLRLFNNSISDASPLSGLTNLTALSLSSNSISDVSSLAGLTNLTELYLTNNSISDVSSLSGLTNLTALFLGNNSISDVSPLSGLTNLATLRLYSNPISDVSPLSGLTNLTLLDLNNNSLSRTQVDAVLNYVDGWGTSNGDLNVSGNNAAPSAAGLAKVSTLQARGWTVTYSS